MQKTKQLEFLSWRERRRPAAPRVLGLKEPVTWTSDQPPEALVTLLSNAESRCIMMVRHPYDVVVSGLRRGSETRNWPGYTIEEHCRLWIQAILLTEWLQRSRIPVLLLRWEDLILANEAAKDSIEAFIRFPLPAFSGFERDTAQLDAYRQTLTRAHGIRDNRRRADLSICDRDMIASLLAQRAEDLGYRLDRS